ncbi:PulJ/GspJ family protein [Oceanithermus sp.]
MKWRAGFTIIEVLIAAAILVVLIGSLMAPLGNLFRMTKRNQQLLDNTTIAQQAVEKIVRDWRDQSRFSHSCLDPGTRLPDGVTVTVQDLSVTGDPVSPMTYVLRNCSGSGDSVSLKRVTVTAAANDGKPAVIVMDIARPQ